MDYTHILATLAASLAALSAQVASTTPPAATVQTCRPQQTIALPAPSEKARFAQCLSQEKKTHADKFSTYGDVGFSYTSSDVDRVLGSFEKQMQDCMQSS